MAASFLVFGLRIYPRRGAVWRAFAATLAWAAVAGLGDLITGGNYMYLRAKPVHSSLLSVMGPWPWYIAIATAVGLAMLLLVAGLTSLFAVHPRGRILPAYTGVSHRTGRGLYSPGEE